MNNKKSTPVWNFNFRVIGRGPLYQVRRSDGKHADVDEKQCVFGTKTPINEWLKGEEPIFSKVYDQYGSGRDAACFASKEI